MGKNGPESQVKIDFKDKVVLFDFDGTLVVTEEIAHQVIKDYLIKKKIPNEDVFSEMITGRTWKAATERMVEYAHELGYEIDSAEFMQDLFKREYRLRFETEVLLVPGVKEKLAEIKLKARYLGVVTGSDHSEVKTIMNAHGLTHFFERVWAFGDYAHSKPDPAPYLQAMSDLKCHPDEVIVFEDSEAGMESAHRAGLKWIQIAYERHALVPDQRSLMVIQDWHQLKV